MSTDDATTSDGATYEIEVDRSANVLFIDLNGRLTAEELEDAAADTLAAANMLSDGFHVINDLTGFRPPSPEAAKPIKEAQGGLVERGVDRVIRVVDDDTSSVVTYAFERRSKDVGYSGETAESVAAAERRLAEESVVGHADSGGDRVLS
jgi:hypothetical protein